MVRFSGTCFGRNLCPAWWQHLWPPPPPPPPTVWEPCLNPPQRTRPEAREARSLVFLSLHYVPMLHSTLMPSAFSALRPEDGLPCRALPELQKLLCVHAGVWRLCLHSSHTCEACVISSQMVLDVFRSMRLCKELSLSDMLISVVTSYYKDQIFLFFYGKVFLKCQKSGLNCRITISIIEALCKPHDFPADSKKSVISEEAINT